MTAADGGGVSPTLGARDLVEAVAGLAAVADVEATTLMSAPGASLRIADLLECLAWARSAIASGAAGVVLTQGTDTLEESAYLLDLFWDLPNPLVVTGAMRPPQHAGADGPANVLAAVTVAAAESARDRGVLVVLHDEVHAAARVRKGHSTSLGAFVSPSTGPVGGLVDGQLALTRPGDRHGALPMPVEEAFPRIALVESTLDDGGMLLAAVVEAGWDGVVVGGFGVGHVSAHTADVVARAAETMPVVVATRTGAGSTLTRTYDFDGSESDLLRRGAVMAGWLDPRKSRLLLWALVAAGCDAGRIEREFARRGRWGAPA